MLSLAVPRAKEGDGQTFAFLSAPYAEEVLGYARRIIRDRDDAEGITQQAFAKLLRVIGEYQERDVPFSAWMIG
jgi:RNA polymerase sigma-70 factor (ECF subfamily)